MSPRSPTTAEVLRQYVEHRLSSLHVCLPGIIQTYDPVTQTANVQIALHNVVQYADGSGEDELVYPVLQLVPVAQPRAGAWRIHMPVSPGDIVTLLFSERSLDVWRQVGGLQNPLDMRKHDISDAIALPINLYPDAAKMTGVTSNSLMLGNEEGSAIHINQDGSIGVGSQVPTDSVATALKVQAELASTVTDFFTPVAAVPAAVDLATALTAINAILAAAKVLVLSGFPHSTASTKVKVDP